MIGRQAEKKELLAYAMSDRPEFVVVYGRRRVGKTYLVRQTFDDDFFFHFTGIANSTKEELLGEFARALHRYGTDHAPPPQSWFDAFDALRGLVERGDAASKKVIFLDEMPWMDTRKSRFTAALEQFWNGWASGRSDVLLIACGSATSWISNKLFRNKGGLYNRVTRQIKLLPFTLAECRDYYTQHGISMNIADIFESYMIFGGIPYYLSLFEKKFGLPQNVEHLCFGEDAKLRDEFEQLFASIFDDPHRYIAAVRAIGAKKKGMTREEIVTQSGLPDGGNVTRILKELAESGFIRQYDPVGAAKKNALFQLADPFTLFFLSFMEGRPGRKDRTYWSKYAMSPSHNAWSGYAFEQVCLAHVAQIKRALGIGGVIADVSSWRSRKKKDGAQIDLVIDRSDQVINLCEIKFVRDEFVIDDDYAKKLRRKRELFRTETRTSKALHLTMITLYGVAPGEHSGMVQSEVAAADLL